MDLRTNLVRNVLTLTDVPRLRRQVYDYPAIRGIRLSGDTDLFLPRDQSGDLPLIVDLHGGGLAYGDKLLNRWSASEMALRGYAVATMNYPLLPQATVIRQIQTILDGLRALQQMRLPLDLDRVILKGDSAGALLALLTAILAGDPAEARGLKVGHDFPIRGLAMLHPMVETVRSDILGYISGHLGIDRELPGLSPRSIKKRLSRDLDDLSWRDRILLEPVSGIAGLPPVWLITSQNDVMFNPEGVRFARALAARGVDHEYHDLPWQRPPLNHVFMVTSPQLPQSQQMYDRLAAYFSGISELQ